MLKFGHFLEEKSEVVPVLEEVVARSANDELRGRREVGVKGDLIKEYNIPALH